MIITNVIIPSERNDHSAAPLIWFTAHTEGGEMNADRQVTTFTSTSKALIIFKY